jgi:16S rRNA (guanine(966)-N(2))-methyltransferase RsmD
MVREAAFSVLADLVVGARVLDLFAGSGAYGLEALSRGAAEAVFVDDHPMSIEAIRLNLSKTKLTGKVVRNDAFRFLKKQENQYRLVFADPPYTKSAGDRDFAGELMENASLAAAVEPGGLLVLECSPTQEVIHSRFWEISRTKKYRATNLYFCFHKDFSPDLLFLYNLLLPIALLLSFPFYLRRMLKRGGYTKNFSQRFGRYSKELADRFAEGGWTWIRAVSVGEIVLALRLIEELKRQSPDFKAVISTTTSTGYALGQERRDNRAWIEIIYNPIDVYPIVSACWRQIRPREAILIDSDLWPSFLAVAKAHRSPVYLANARLSPRSEKRYTRLRSVTKTLFWRNVTSVFAQDQVDAERWKRLGVPTDRITD